MRLTLPASPTVIPASRMSAAGLADVELAETLGWTGIAQNNIVLRYMSNKDAPSAQRNATPARMPARKPISKSQYENLAAFRFALRRFMRFSEDAASAAGLTPQQHQALLAIKGFPGRDHVTVGELAERLQTKHHSTVGLIDRLVLEDCVERDVSLTDRRQVFIRLTPRGERMLEDLSAMHREQLRTIGPELRALLQCLGQGESLS
jgi:DNA-binding MarR family transcriptional regulator